MITGTVVVGTVYRQNWISVMIRVTAVRHHRHWHWEYRRFTSLMIIILTFVFCFTALGSHVSFLRVVTDWIKRFSAHGICYIDLIMFYTPKFTASDNKSRQQWNLYFNKSLAIYLLTDIRCNTGSFYLFTAIL